MQALANALSSWGTLNQNARATFEEKFVRVIKELNIDPFEYPKFIGYSKQVDQLTKTFQAFLDETSMEGEVKGELDARFLELIRAKNSEIETVIKETAQRIQKVALATIKAIACLVSPNDLPFPSTAFGGSVNKELYSKETIMTKLIKGSVTFPAEDPQAALYIIKICFDILKEQPKERGIIPELDNLLEQIVEITGDADVLKSVFFKAAPLISSLIKAKGEAQAAAAAKVDPRIKQLKEQLDSANAENTKQGFELSDAKSQIEHLERELKLLREYRASFAAKPPQAEIKPTELQKELAELTRNAS